MDSMFAFNHMVKAKKPKERRPVGQDAMDMLGDLLNQHGERRVTQINPADGTARGSMHRGDFFNQQEEDVLERMMDEEEVKQYRLIMRAPSKRDEVGRARALQAAEAAAAELLVQDPESKKLEATIGAVAAAQARRARLAAGSKTCPDLRNPKGRASFKGHRAQGALDSALASVDDGELAFLRQGSEHGEGQGACPGGLRDTAAGDSSSTSSSSLGMAGEGGAGLISHISVDPPEPGSAAAWLASKRAAQATQTPSVTAVAGSMPQGPQGLQGQQPREGSSPGLSRSPSLAASAFGAGTQALAARLSFLGRQASRSSPQQSSPDLDRFLLSEGQAAAAPPAAPRPPSQFTLLTDDEAGAGGGALCGASSGYCSSSNSSAAASPLYHPLPAARPIYGRRSHDIARPFLPSPSSAEHASAAQTGVVSLACLPRTPSGPSSAGSPVAFPPTPPRTEPAPLRTSDSAGSMVLSSRHGGGGLGASPSSRALPSPRLSRISSMAEGHGKDAASMPTWAASAAAANNSSSSSSTGGGGRGLLGSSLATAGAGAATGANATSKIQAIGAQAEAARSLFMNLASGSGSPSSSSMSSRGPRGRSLDLPPGDAAPAPAAAAALGGHTASAGAAVGVSLGALRNSPNGGGGSGGSGTMGSNSTSGGAASPGLHRAPGRGNSRLCLASGPAGPPSSSYPSTPTPSNLAGSLASASAALVATGSAGSGLQVHLPSMVTDMQPGAASPRSRAPGFGTAMGLSSRGPAPTEGGGGPSGFTAGVEGMLQRLPLIRQDRKAPAKAQSFTFAKAS